MSFFRDLFTIGPDPVMAGTHRHERPRWMGRYGGSDDEGSGYRDVGHREVVGARRSDGLRHESNGLLPRDELLKCVDHPMTA